MTPTMEAGAITVEWRVDCGREGCFHSHTTNSRTKTAAIAVFRFEGWRLRHCLWTCPCCLEPAS